MTHKDQVVYSDNGRYARVADALWKFAREAVEEADAVSFQVFHDAFAAPPSLGQCVSGPHGVNPLHITSCCELTGEFFSTFVGCVEQQPKVVSQGRQRVDQRPTISSKPRSIANNAFGIKANNRFSFCIHRAAKLQINIATPFPTKNNGYFCSTLSIVKRASGSGIFAEKTSIKEEKR